MPSERANVMADRAGKCLTFKLGDEEYGLPILKVQEIIGMMKVTRVPRTPGFVRGVINLRGKVIPVIDLRRKFQMERREDTDKTCIIVVQIGFEAKTATMGMIVDEVSEVRDIGAEQIEPPPAFGAAVDTEFIWGMGKIDHKVVTLLDVDKTLSAGDMAMVNRAVESA